MGKRRMMISRMVSMRAMASQKGRYLTLKTVVGPAGKK